MQRTTISIVLGLLFAVAVRSQEIDRTAALAAAKGGIGEIDRFIMSRLDAYRDRFDVRIDSMGGGRPASIVATSSFRVESKELDLELERGVEFIAHSARGPGQWSASGKIIFVGYGIDAPEIDWNDFKDVDVSKKVCFVLPGVPPVATPLDRLATTAHVRPTAKVGRLLARGAAAVVFVHRPTTPESAAAEWKAIVGDHARRRIGLVDPTAPAVEAFMPWDVARVMCSGSGENMANLELRARERNFRPVPLDVTATLAVEVVAEKSPSPPERIAIDLLPRAAEGLPLDRGVLVAGPRRKSSTKDIPKEGVPTETDSEATADLLALQFATIDRWIAATGAKRHLRIVLWDDASARRSGEVEPFQLWSRDMTLRPPLRAVLFDAKRPGDAVSTAFTAPVAALADPWIRKISGADARTVTQGSAAVSLGCSGLVDAPILGMDAMRIPWEVGAGGDGQGLLRLSEAAVAILTSP